MGEPDFHLLAQLFLPLLDAKRSSLDRSIQTYGEPSSGFRRSFIQSVDSATGFMFACIPCSSCPSLSLIEPAPDIHPASSEFP